MCDVIAVAAVGVAVSAGSAYASNQAQSSAAKKQGAYNAAVERQQLNYRTEVMGYQNEVWQQDIQYAGDLLSWAEGEWDRGIRNYSKAAKAVEKNTIAGVGQVLLRQVEEDMLTIMRGDDARRRGTAARSSIAARDRGVEGNSVDAIINDVTRQEGEALSVMAMNRSASLRALNREAVAVDAHGDQQLGSLAVKTYAPNALIRSPAPVSPVNPAAPVAGPSSGQLIAGVAGAAMQGVTNYSTWSGQPVKDTLGQMQSWTGRQLRVE